MGYRLKLWEIVDLSFGLNLVSQGFVRSLHLSWLEVEFVCSCLRVLAEFFGELLEKHSLL